MIKKLLKGVVKVSVIVFSFVLFPRLYSKMQAIFQYGYSIWISRFFPNKNFASFLYPITNIMGAKYIRIGKNCSFGKRFRIEALDTYMNQKFTPQIIIGKNVAIGDDCHIGAIHNIIIEDNVLMASKIYISDHSHGKIEKKELGTPPAKRELYSKGDVWIKENCWIGENVAILPNVTLGKNCIIGANSVVTKSFPDNCVIGGVPAKIIRIL